MTDVVDENITEIDMASEVESSFLKYSLSVVLSRALPDVRDGLKPVHRRILYIMHDDGVSSAKKTVKSARVVGSVLGKAHPHGDSAVYDAMVRLAQPWNNNIPFVQGQGNFGSVGGEDPAAAARYTECRMTPAAEAMLESIDEDTVEWQDNYDATMKEPIVLPSAIPNLLVNGTSGIAVGMACSFAPHNLREVCAALRLLLEDPEASLDQVMEVLPGPDFPTGGILYGSDGIRKAFETGRGSIKVRAKTAIEQVSAKRQGIVVTELPYGVGPESIMEKVADLKKAGHLEGVSNIVNYTDRKHGLRLVVSVKPGFKPEMVLEELFRKTALQQSFSVNNVALVGTAPTRMGLLELCQHFLNHRVEVVTRRTRFRLRKAQARQHIVEGLVTAHSRIDEVVRVIKASKSTKDANEALQEKFDLTEIQAANILEMTLRRLTGLEIESLQKELVTLGERITELQEILASEQRIRDIVSAELQQVSDKFGTDRKSTLAAGALPDAPGGEALSDDPVVVGLTASGELVAPPTPDQVVVSTSVTSTLATAGVVTSMGRLLSLDMRYVNGVPAPVRELVEGLEADEHPVGLVPRTGNGSVFLATRGGMIKKIAAGEFAKRDGLSVIGLKDGDELLVAQSLQSVESDVVLVASHGKLLRTSLGQVRAQGRTAGGVSGMKLPDGERLLMAGEVREGTIVTTFTNEDTGKATPVSVYPAKGRGGAGVRCHGLRAKETGLAWAAIGEGSPVVVGKRTIKPVKVVEKRDAAGLKCPFTPPIVALGFQVEVVSPAQEDAA